MRPILWAVSVAMVSWAGSAAADTYPKDPEVDVVHYAFRLALSDETDRITAEATIDVRILGRARRSLALDFAGSADSPEGMRVSAVAIDGEAARFVHADDRLRLALPAAVGGGERLQVHVSYQGVPQAGLLIGTNRHGDRMFAADNWPTDARHWLPTVDHPYDKATCEFIVTAPDHYQVVSNGRRIEETSLPDGRRLTHWRQSVPIASWLMVIAAGRYAVQHLESSVGVPIETWVYRPDRDAGFFDFARAGRILGFFDAHVGPYPYEKLANVQVAAPIGAMENATAIFYAERSVTGDRRREATMAHEIAHQWFGNSVTEHDWDDVWLSEGFATYFALLFTEFDGGRDRFVEGLERSRRRVLEFDRENPGYRIVHDNLSDMSQVLTSQIYQKGAWTLHMLRGLMGDADFWRGIREYYRAYRDATASTDDFRRAMEDASGLDLAAFFQQWLRRGGVPRLAATWSYDAAAQRLRLDVEQVQPGDPFVFPLGVGVRLPSDPEPRVEVLEVDAREQAFEVPLEQRPISVVLDPEVWLLLDAELTGG